MDSLKALGRGTQLMFVSAVLLIIVSFLRWQEVSVSLGALGSVSGGRNALHGFWGWLMFLLTIVLVARIAARLAAVEIPIPLSFATTSFVLGVLIALSAILKVVTDDYTKFWAYIGVVLAILVAIGAWLEVQEAGGVEHLRSQATSVAGSVSTAASGTAGGAAAAAPEAPAATTTPPPPPAAAPTETAGGGVQSAEAAGGASEPAAEAISGAEGAAGEAASEAADDLPGGPSTGGGA